MTKSEDVENDYVDFWGGSPDSMTWSAEPPQQFRPATNKVIYHPAVAFHHAPQIADGYNWMADDDDDNPFLEELW